MRTGWTGQANTSLFAPQALATKGPKTQRKHVHAWQRSTEESGNGGDTDMELWATVVMIQCREKCRRVRRLEVLLVVLLAIRRPVGSGRAGNKAKRPGLEDSEADQMYELERLHRFSGDFAHH